MEKTVVRDGNEGVNLALEVGNALFGNIIAAAAFESERFGDNTNSQGASLFCAFSHDVGSPRASTTAHAGRNKDHIRTFEEICQLVLIFLGRFLTDFRIGTCAESSRYFFTNLDLGGGLAGHQCLCIAVYSHEFNTLQTRIDHAVYGVVSATTDTDNFDFFQRLLPSLLLFRFKHLHGPPHIDYLNRFRL